jgi:hypothetical protein
MWTLKGLLDALTRFVTVDEQEWSHVYELTVCWASIDIWGNTHYGLRHQGWDIGEVDLGRLAV